MSSNRPSRKTLCTLNPSREDKIGQSDGYRKAMGRDAILFVRSPPRIVANTTIGEVGLDGRAASAVTRVGRLVFRFGLHTMSLSGWALSSSVTCACRKTAPTDLRRAYVCQVVLMAIPKSWSMVLPIEWCPTWPRVPGGNSATVHWQATREPSEVLRSTPAVCRRP